MSATAITREDIRGMICCMECMFREVLPLADKTMALPKDAGPQPKQTKAIVDVYIMVGELADAILRLHDVTTPPPA